MEKKALLWLLVIFLGLSFLAYVAAVPKTRSSMIGKFVPSMQDHHAKVPSLQEDPAVGLNNNKELFDMHEEEEEEGVVENSRMMLDIADYPETRPNPAHDPKNPGKP